LLSWSCSAVLFFCSLEKLYSSRFQCWDFGAEIASLLWFTLHDRLRCLCLFFSPDWDENQFTLFVGEQSTKTFAPSLLEKYVLFQQNNVQILQLWCQGKQIECIQSEPLMVSSVDWVHIRSEPFDGFLSSPGIAYIKSLLSLAVELHFYTDSCVSWPIVFNLALIKQGHTPWALRIRIEILTSFLTVLVSVDYAWVKTFLNLQRKIPLEWWLMIWNSEFWICCHLYVVGGGNFFSLIFWYETWSMANSQYLTFVMGCGSGADGHQQSEEAWIRYELWSS
jgi:hypothetical protein